MEAGNMEREDLLKKLSEERLAYFQSMGLSPFKCGQVVAETLESWEKLPTEKLEELMEKGQF